MSDTIELMLVCPCCGINRLRCGCALDTGGYCRVHPTRQHETVRCDGCGEAFTTEDKTWQWTGLLWKHTCPKDEIGG